MPEGFKFTFEEDDKLNMKPMTFAKCYGYYPNTDWNVFDALDVAELKHYLRYGKPLSKFWTKFLSMSTMIRSQRDIGPKYVRNSVDEIFWREYCRTFNNHVVGIAIGSKTAVKEWYEAGGADGYFKGSM